MVVQLVQGIGASLHRKFKRCLLSLQEKKAEMQPHAQKLRDGKNTLRNEVIQAPGVLP